MTGKVIIEQADRLRNLVDRLLGPQLPGTRVTESIHKVAERVVTLVSMELPDNVRLIRDYDPSLPELAHDPDQIEQRATRMDNSDTLWDHLFEDESQQTALPSALAHYFAQLRGDSPGDALNRLREAFMARWQRADRHAVSESSL